MVHPEPPLTAEQREIRAIARDFAEMEIRPHASRWDADRELSEGIFGKVAEMGFFGMLVPERYGGIGLDMLTYLLVLEELAWGDASVALSVAVHNGPVAHSILRHGSESQRREFLPRLASGGSLAAFALSEPGAGGDATRVRSRAVADGEGWRISGRKRCIANGARADIVLLFARTGEGEEGPDGVGAFLIDRDGEGYDVEKRERTLGLRASETAVVRLDDLFVDRSRLLGESGLAFRYAMEALDVGRVGIAALSLGIARAAFEHAVSYSREREQFGRPIADFGAIRTKIAEMATRISAARLLTYEVGRRMDEAGGKGGSGRAHGTTAAAAMAKLTASETAMSVTDEAVQVFGGYGYMSDYPVEKLMRDAKGTEIVEGPSEILRNIIAREAIGRRSSR